MTVIPPDSSHVASDITRGDHDEHLDRIAEAIRQRKDAVEPWESLFDLLSIRRAMVDKRGESVTVRAQVGASLNHDLKKFTSHPNEHVQALAKQLLQQVFTDLLGVPAKTARDMMQSGVGKA